MNYVRKYQLLRIRCAMILSATKRTAWIRKHNFFYSMGENIHFEPRKLPADPKLIKLHNNICVATDVKFLNHDIVHMVLNNIDKDVRYKSHLGCIEIMDNVFIGANSIIMANVKIGPNAIIGAGSVVTKDVPPDSVVAGVPARVIGKFSDFMKKRREESLKIDEEDRFKRIDKEWKIFESIHNNEQ